MTIDADLSVAVQIVEQNPLIRDRMVIGRHLFAGQPWIAVAFRYVAEYLIVRSVLLDDVDDVFDRRPCTHALRNDAGFLWRPCEGEVVVFVRDVVVHLLRPRFDGASQVVDRDDIDCAPLDVADRFVRRPPDQQRTRRAVGVRMRLHSLAVADIQLHLGRELQGARVPARRDKAQHVALAGFADVDDGNAVVVRIGDEQHIVLVIERESIRSAALWRACGRSDVNGLDGLALPGIDDRDSVFIAVRDVQAAVAAELQIIGIPAGRDGRDYGCCGDIDDPDVVAAQLLTYRIDPSALN
ncbi:MAG TPA: hypothetical protein VFL57_03065 [Bryobacteraceae bacterium]|nr:hypothetical protein [Bryobacteraceae bacterium]